MADSFFGFDTSLSNLNDDDGGGGDGSEEEYNALNDETFGVATDDFDWEVEHEQLAEQLESSRKHRVSYDDSVNSQLEASLSQLVLDETDLPPSSTFNTSNVWQHELQPYPTSSNALSQLKNVCTVEELERQLRQKQHQQPALNQNQNFFQPRFPVILQRPQGMQAPVPLPYAPQQQSNNLQQQMSQPISKILNQNNQMLSTNQLTQNVNQFLQSNQFQNSNQMQTTSMMQNINQGLNQPGNQMMQNTSLSQANTNQIIKNQLSQNNQMMQNQLNQNNQLLQNPISHNNSQMLQNHLGQTGSQLMQNHSSPMGQSNQMLPNQLGQSGSQLLQTMNQMPQPALIQNHITQSNNQMMQNQMTQGGNQLYGQLGQSGNQLMQNVNQLGQPGNQMMQNMGQSGQGNNQMGQANNQLGQGNNQLSQGNNHLGQIGGQLGQMGNQLGQMPNGNQFGSGMNQMMPQHMMGQPRMVPPPGLNMPRQNFNSNMGQFNTNFRGPSMPSKPMDQSNQQNQANMMMNQYTNQQPQLGHQSPQITNQNQMKQNQQLMNQSPQLSQNMNQPKPVQNQQSAPRTDQKLQPQKTRTQVFNNSNQKNLTQQNLTSQNLVQMIQNTHPMLQFNMNSSYHNASHHPMLNNRNTFNSQVMNAYPLFTTQRLNGSFNSSDSERLLMNGEDHASMHSVELDEYAGLMNAREKQWLLNIQFIQLNTSTPYIDDFYYTVFRERKARKEKEGIKEAHKSNQQNHPFYSSGVKQDQRERRNSGRHNSTSEDAPTPRIYVPTQFENSLGKLQCGSVTAPRKIIDVDVVQAEGAGAAPGRQSRAASVASTANHSEAPQVRRTKQVLLDIEALYLILLRLEELNDPLALSNALELREREEKQRKLEAAQRDAQENGDEETNVFLRNIESVHRRRAEPGKEDKRQAVSVAAPAAPPARNLLDEDEAELLNRMFAGLLHEDRLQQFMMVRKGKALVCRFLARCPAAHGRARGAWARVLRALPAAARRADDRDATLAPLAAHFHRYIQSSSGWSAALEACALLAEALDPARTPHALSTAFTLSAVCSLIEKATTLATTADATSNERQWTKFLRTLARALKNTSLKVARPLHPLHEKKLLHHIRLLESRSTIEILPRGRTAAEFADLSKTDFSEQLIRHLC